MSSSPSAPVRPRRGRPPKFGRRGQLVAVTLPEEVLEHLRARHADLGWAIVDLVEQHTGAPADRAGVDAPPLPASLLDVAPEHSLIVVHTALFRSLPGVRLIPLTKTQSFLALEPGRGLADLELAVIDRLETPRVAAPEREALTGLLQQLRKWRRDRTLSFETRSIILVQRRPTGRRAER